MSLLDLLKEWLEPRKLASPRRSVKADPSTKLIRDLVATRTPMSLATLKAASDAASGPQTAEQPATTVGRLPPISRCSMAGIGMTPVC